jgi:hypothetical protein
MGSPIFLKMNDKRRYSDIWMTNVITLIMIRRKRKRTPLEEDVFSSCWYSIVIPPKYDHAGMVVEEIHRDKMDFSLQSYN